MTAISGSKSDTVDVTVGGAYSPPTASINLTPSGEARKTQSILFSGSLSEDLDGEIVRYLWTIFSDNPDPNKANPYINDTTNQAFNESFTNEQTLDITLQVTDDDGATGSDVEQLAILVNIAPKAEAGPAMNGTVTAGPPYACSVQLSGAQSADQDGSTCPQCAIATYEWNWGDGRIDRISGSTIAQHTYRAAGAYTVNLIVYDNGRIHPPDPRTAQADPGRSAPCKSDAHAGSRRVGAFGRGRLAGRDPVLRHGRRTGTDPALQSA